jgi:hypothetical protein
MRGWRRRLRDAAPYLLYGLITLMGLVLAAATAVLSPPP